MRTFFPDILIPLFAALGAASAASELVKKNAPVLPGRFAEKYLKKLNGKQLALGAVAAMGVIQLVLLLLLDIIITHMTIGLAGRPAQAAGSTGIGIVAMFAACFLGQTGLVTEMFGKCEAFKSFFRRTAIVSAVLLLLECFVFNGRALTADPYHQRVGELTLTQGAEYADGMDNVWFTLYGSEAAVEMLPDQRTRAINVCVKQETGADMIQLTAYIKDGNFSRTWQQADQRWVAGNGETVSLNLDPYASLHGVRLVFGNYSGTVSVMDVTESAAPRFVFMDVRYLLLLIVCILVIAVRAFRLDAVVYNPAKNSHRAVIACIAVLCTLSPLLLATQQENIKYDPEMDYSSQDPFIKTFDAFQHGQANLRLEVPPELAELDEETLYDRSARDETGIYYRWDHAFFKGKYYSYFGITPLVTLYYPMYWLTGKLPTLSFAVMFFSVLAAAFTCLAEIAGVTLLVKKPNLLMLCMTMPASVAALGLLHMIQNVGMYILPVTAAICFLMLSLWLGFSALAAKKKLPMYLLFAGSGLALGLTAGARPSIAISAAILIPLFLGVLMNREAKWGAKLTKAGVFAAPLFLVIIGLMIYNKARFGSYTDFGAAYQLTVSNVKANNLRLYAFPDGIYHYLLQPLNITGNFPFISMTWQSLPNYERYRFSYSNFGALWFPMLTAGLLLLRTACTGSNAESGSTAVTKLQKKAVLLTGFATVFIVAWMDFCLAGCGSQYIFDITPLMGLCAAVVLNTAANPECRLRYRVSCVSCCLTVLVAAFLLIGYRDGTVHAKYPMLYQTAESLLIFWH